MCVRSQSLITAVITINLSKSGFEDNAEQELARILTELAWDIENGGWADKPLILYDRDYNQVGTFRLSEEARA